MMKLEVVGAERVIARVRWASAALRMVEIPIAVEKTVVVAQEKARDMIGRENTWWKPLAASTVREKKRLGYVWHRSRTDPLLRTGKMLRSIESRTSGMVGAVYSRDPVSRWQDQGTKTIPPRHFIVPAMQRSAAFSVDRLAAAWRRAWG